MLTYVNPTGGGGGKEYSTSVSWIEFLLPTFRDYMFHKPGLKRRRADPDEKHHDNTVCSRGVLKDMIGHEGSISRLSHNSVFEHHLCVPLGVLWVRLPHTRNN